MLTVSRKTSCPRHSWLEDVIQPDLTGGNLSYAGEGDAFPPYILFLLDHIKMDS